MAPLAAALHDPAVAAAGGFGLVSVESGPLRPNGLRPFVHVAAGTADASATPGPSAVGVAALEAAWLAFRRSDYAQLGPIDERFLTPAWLDVWWTLRLRAGAEPEGAEYVESQAGESEAGEERGASMPATAAPVVELTVPRRAVRFDLPLDRENVTWPPDRSRLSRRNMYRVLDRFGWREDLT